MSKTAARRRARVPKKLAPHSDGLPETPAFGSWLLGRVSESQRHRRIRIQVMLTLAMVLANMIGIGAVVLLLTIAIPTPSVFTDAPLWVTWVITPAYAILALTMGIYWITRQILVTLSWAIAEREPSSDEARNTFLAPLRVAVFHLIAWGFGALLLAGVYGLVNISFIPQFFFSISTLGIVVAISCYLITEFALRPVAAQALVAGTPPQRWVQGLFGRSMLGWLLGAGMPLSGLALMSTFEITRGTLTKVQYAIGVVTLSTMGLFFGFLLTALQAWLTTTPIRVVRVALKRVEQGDLQANLVVFDGTEIGELQRGFNSMVTGLRERERVRDLFGRHVGRDVAAAAERERPQLGGEERHVAVVFVDIVGSTHLVTSQPPKDVVILLNQFFAIAVDEVDRHHGLVNKFQGDAALAIFGAPNHLECPEDEALAAARAIADRLTKTMSNLEAGIGVAAGPAVAGNVGANERFEYTVIGEPVNEAARLCELAKAQPKRLLASASALDGASENECAHWSFGDTVTLRGYDQPTRLAIPS
ncbi:adenylate/guanylate cyclase domain-containing protein [Mycobacterium spongiae]|uniref:HAMP domain-containing protein n=1 Tax=Mycobacterium spongiae TaxID=886343 RepID=A0A975K0H8_9MYCO|nr:adenylate/guanylate cyclase domain-containing protein [Mycobacterium spongiae]QUR68434.1 HAMP domain-containing protein [Mycobacterium spongiae]